MAIVPKLTGDLGQRFVVRQRYSEYHWRAVGWADTYAQAEAIVRHCATDHDALEMAIADRQLRLPL